MLRIVRGMETTIHATQYAFAAHARVGGSHRVSGGWRERAAWAARLPLLEPRLRDRVVAVLVTLDDPEWALPLLGGPRFAALGERLRNELLAALGEGQLDAVRWEALGEAGFGERLDENVARALVAALGRGAPPELAELTVTSGFAAASREEQLELVAVIEGLGRLGAEGAWMELLVPEGDAAVERERLRDLLHRPRFDAWVYEPMGPAGRAIVLVGDPTQPLVSFGQAVIGGRRQQRWVGVSSPDPLVANHWVGGDVLTHGFQRWTLSGRELVRFVEWVETTFVARREGATPPARRFVAEVEQTLRALVGPRAGQAEHGTAYRGERLAAPLSGIDTDCEMMLDRFLAA